MSPLQFVNNTGCDGFPSTLITARTDSRAIRCATSFSARTKYGRKISNFPPGAFSPSLSFFSGLGTATLIAVLVYGGYVTVCFCGGEVQQPSRTIPASILYAIVGRAEDLDKQTSTISSGPAGLKAESL